LSISELKTLRSRDSRNNAWQAWEPSQRPDDVSVD
jgi:hypothetical protein